MDVNRDYISRKLSRARALIFALMLTLAGGFGYATTFAQQDQRAQLPTPADLSRTFIGVAKQIKPTVVNIDVTEKSRRSTLRALPQIPGFPPFEGQPRRQRGTGSGVIISADGYILTNNHVVGEADEIKVKLADGREVKATRVGTDPDTDLAVIKVDVPNLPYAKLGDSERVEQGEWVIALGSPFGLQQTMTAGIVSATGRDLPGAGQFTNFIQTDASINPGNSGGPLINMQGEVIGINTLIFSQTGASSGIGFAIPSNLATKIYAQLIKSGKVTRGYLGVYPSEVTPALAKAVGYTGTEGAIIRDLPATGPAARAGLRSGDVIIEVDGKAVKSPKQLTELVSDLPVGKAVKVRYVRDGRTETASINLGERPRAGSPDPEQNGNEDENPGKLGLRMQSLTPEMAREMKLKIATGAIVISVQPDGPAAEAGVQVGDVIHKINRTQVVSAQNVTDTITALKGEKEFVMQIEREGQLFFLTVTLE